MFIRTHSTRYAAAAIACFGVVSAVAAQSADKKPTKEPVEFFSSDLAMNGPTAPCDGTMITTNDVQPGDYDANALAMNGTMLLMGAPSNDNGQGTNAGAAYVFSFSNGLWSQTQKLFPGAIHAGDWFGSALCLNNLYAAIGAQYADPAGADSGEVVPCHRNGSTLVIEPFITAWDGAASDHFGAAVAMGTDWLVVSAPYKTVNNQPLAGKIYAYRRFGSTWGWHQDLHLPVVASFDTLGTSLAMTENTFAAGATGVNTGGFQDSGAVLIGQAILISANPFAANWVTQTVTPNDPQASAHFGASVAISGNYLYVGAPDADDPSHPDDGAVYVFQNTSPGVPQYQQIARLTHLNMEAHFGRSIAVDGTKIVISDANGNLYTYTQFDTNPPSGPMLTGVNWSHAAFNASFGAALAISNGQIVAGDSLYNLSVTGDEGAAFILAQPANDDCANAVTIGQGVVNGCTFLATNDGASSCSPGDQSHDVWFKIVGDANNAGPWLVHSNTDYDSMISVHSGCPATAVNEITCDDDQAGNLDAVVRFNVQAGSTYMIRMTGYYNSAGPFQLIARKNTCPADIAPLPLGNGQVDIDDLVMVITHWSIGWSMADVTGDHWVNIDDLVKVITSWGNCP